MTTKLNQIDADNIYRAFQEWDIPGDTWVGKWAIFKNDQIQYIHYRYTYNTRGPCTNNRNSFIQRINGVRDSGGFWNGPIVSFKPNWASEQPPIPFTEPITHLAHTNSIRDEEPELFARLQQLYVVRQITQQDIPAIAVRLGGPP